MPVLNNQPVADRYPDNQPGAIISQVYNARGGWLSVSGAGVYCQQQYGRQGASVWTEEVGLGSGAFVQLAERCTGVRFRNAVAGQAATVTVQIAQGAEPSLAVVALGSVLVTGAGLLNYTEIQADVALAGIAEASASLLIDSGVQTYSAVPIIVEGWGHLSWGAGFAVGDAIVLEIFDAGAVYAGIGQVWRQPAPENTFSYFTPFYFKRRFTPTSGQHQFTLRGYSAANTTKLLKAGTGLAAGNPPAALQIALAPT